jgi:uncharacterized protein
MLAIQDLINEPSSIGNYFSPETYVQGDFESGLVENRNGDRLIAIPNTLIQGIYAALGDELGPGGASIVLFKWGVRWGKNSYRRFAGEIEQHYGKPLAQFEMVELLQCLKQCWKTYGWGLLEFDAQYYQHGFLVLQLQNAPFAQLAPKTKHPAGHVESGILSAFFTQLTGRNLHCVQTSCESMGAATNHFVLGMADRLKPVEAWLQEGQDHTTIMDRLCGQQAASGPKTK